jgi:hypothetical protein
MTSQPPDPYGQSPQNDPYGQGTPPPSSGQPGYPPPGPGFQPPQQPATNTLAIVSLVCSLAGLVTVISAPVGAVLGHVARKQIRQRGEQGEGMAMAGIIVGWVLTGLYLLGCCGLIVLVVAAENTSV